MVKNFDEIIQNIKSNQLNNLGEVQSALNSLKPYTHAENKNDEILRQCYGMDGNLKPRLSEIIEVVILDKLLEAVSNIKTGEISQALELLKKYKIVFNPRGEGGKYFFYPPDEINQSGISSSHEKNIWGKIITNTGYHYPQKINKLNEFITQLEKGELPKERVGTQSVGNSETKLEKPTESIPLTETEINQTTYELEGLGFSEDWTETINFDNEFGFVKDGKTWGGLPIEIDNKRDQKLKEIDLHKDLKIKETINDWERSPEIKTDGEDNVHFIAEIINKDISETERVEKEFNELIETVNRTLKSGEEIERKKVTVEMEKFISSNKAFYSQNEKEVKELQAKLKNYSTNHNLPNSPTKILFLVFLLVVLVVVAVVISNKKQKNK